MSDAALLRNEIAVLEAFLKSLDNPALTEFAPGETSIGNVDISGELK
jgi:hypothetical protein